MPKANEIKKGMAVTWNGKLLLVKDIDVQSPSARGAATLYKMRFTDVRTDLKVEERFKGDDIIDAIQLAGGYIENADTQLVNHAQKVQDEMVIYIPIKGEHFEGASTNLFISPMESKNKDQKININIADTETLATLPGIGPLKAKSILSYREENGRFQTIDDLKNISGIGEKTFEKIKDSITVK